MDTIALNFLETAVVGVVGIGASGVASRCMECQWAQQESKPCGGFGEGCMTRQQKEGVRR